MAHELHKKSGNSTLEIIPDVGHYPMLEAPKLWTKAIFTSL